MESPRPNKQGQGQRPAPRLTLITPLLDDAAAFTRALASVLSVADVAAVLLRLAPADERTQINRIRTLAPTVQQSDIALLLDGHPEQVLTQLIGIGAVIVFDAVLSFIILKVIDLVIGLRVDEETEVEGLDLALHGEVVP